MNTKTNLLILTSITSLAHAAVIADHQADFSATTPDTGWAYLWNPTNFTIGTSANYIPLLTNGGGYTTDGNGVNNGQIDSAFLQIGGPGIHPGSGTGEATDGNDHAAIIAYTVQAGEEGSLSIINSSALRSGQFGPDGTFISVYLNDIFIDSVEVPKSADGINPGSALFDFNIGNAAIGDTVYIAVGAGTGAGQDGLNSFGFQIDSIPEPSSALLLGLSGLTISLRRRRH